MLPWVRAPHGCARRSGAVDTSGHAAGYKAESSMGWAAISEARFGAVLGRVVLGSGGRRP